MRCVCGVHGGVMVRCVRGGVDHVCEGEGVSDGCVNSLVLDCLAQGA